MTTDETELRTYVRALFDAADDLGTWGARPEPEPDNPTKPANHVPREGNTPQVDDPQAESREYVRQLFNTAD